MEEDGAYSETAGDGTKVKLQAAKITLNDCLACSGCITRHPPLLFPSTAQTAEPTPGVQRRGRGYFPHSALS